jgi:hypothetical protein
MTPEGEVLTACLSFLEGHGIFAWRNSVGAVQMRPGKWYRFGLKGSSDILGILPGGRLLAVETKAKKGRLSPDQRDFLEAIKARGGVSVMARSVDELAAALITAGVFPGLHRG